MSERESSATASKNPLKGHLEVVKKLLKYSDKETITRKSRSEFDTLHIAARQGHDDGYCIDEESGNGCLQIFHIMIKNISKWNRRTESTLIRYYNNLIDLLLEKGIQPYATLYHWDLPQMLEDEYDGWLNTRIIEDFKHYAFKCFKIFGDRVKHWITFNEPHGFAIQGYDYGIQAPGSSQYSVVSCCYLSWIPRTFQGVFNLWRNHGNALDKGSNGQPKGVCLYMLYNKRCC